MTDRPIIFSGPMVRALLDGLKTQTRRVIKAPSAARLVYMPKGADHWLWTDGDGDSGSVRIPYAPGDRLYVREALQAVTEQDADGTFADCISYAADGAHPKDGLIQWPWQLDMVPSIFCPRWASRLTLTVTEVRVQRLQEISEADAVAEGIWLHTLAGLSGWRDYATVDCMVKRYFSDPRQSYASLWNSLHGPDAWGDNPWVVAVSFSVRQRNIDAA